MAHKFTYEDHQERMRKLLEPRLPTINRLRRAVRRLRLPRIK